MKYNPIYQRDQQGRMSANYTDGKWTVSQELGTISLYSLDGDFDAAIAYLQKKKGEFY